MSLLEDLVGAPLHTLSDEELEAAIITGRAAREYTEPKKDKKAKAGPKLLNDLGINADDFE